MLLFARCMHLVPRQAHCWRAVMRQPTCAAAAVAAVAALLLPSKCASFVVAPVRHPMARPSRTHAPASAAAPRRLSRSCAMSAAASAGTLDAAEVAAFKVWLEKNGVKGGDCLLEVGPSPLDGGRGVLTTAPIKAGQAALTVPCALCITADRVAKGPLGKALKEYDGYLGDTGLIAAQLLWEQHQGAKSAMAPWLALLPPQGGLDLPLFWDATDLQLADRSSTRGFSGLKADVAEDHAWLSANIFNSPASPIPSDAFTLEAFSWVVGCVISRSFFVDGTLQLAPLVDFANHADDPPPAAPEPPAAEVPTAAAATAGAVAGAAAAASSVVKGLFDDNIKVLVDIEDGQRAAAAARARAQLAREPQSCGLGVFGGKGVRLVAGRDYAKGEEFLISYGPKGAAAYLEEHGFLPLGDGGGGAAGSEIELSLEPEEKDRFRDDKEDILETADEPFSSAFDLLPAGTPDPAMQQYARLVVLGGMDAFLLEAVFRSDVWGFMSEPVSMSNEEAANNLIIETCQGHLKGFALSQEQDDELMESGEEGLTRHQSLCAQLRAAERQALIHTANFYATDNTALERKEYYQTRRLRELSLDRPLDESEVYTPGAAGSMPRATSGRDAQRELDW